MFDLNNENLDFIEVINNFDKYVQEIPELENYIKQIQAIQNLINKLNQGEQIKYESLDGSLQKLPLVRFLYTCSYSSLIEKENIKCSLDEYLSCDKSDLENIPQQLFNNSNWTTELFKYNNEYIYPFEIYIQRYKKLPPVNWLFKEIYGFPYLSHNTVKTIIENDIDISALKEHVGDIYDIFVRSMLMGSISVFKKLPQIKGITEKDIHDHIREVVQAFYENDLDVPQELQFEGWTKAPSFKYYKKYYKEIIQYTPYQSWIIFNHNSTIPPKELYYEGAEKEKIDKKYLWGWWIQNNFELPPNELRFEGWEQTTSRISFPQRYTQDYENIIEGNPYQCLGFYIEKYLPDKE